MDAPMGKKRRIPERFLVYFEHPKWYNEGKKGGDVRLLSYDVREDEPLTEAQAKEAVDMAMTLQTDVCHVMYHEAVRLGLTAMAAGRRVQEAEVMETLEALVDAGAVVRLPGGYTRLPSVEEVH